MSIFKNRSFKIQFADEFSLASNFWCLLFDYFGFGVFFGGGGDRGGLYLINLHLAKECFLGKN